MTDCGIRKVGQSINWFTKSAFVLGIGIMLMTLGILEFPHSVEAQAENATALSIGPILTPYGTPATNATVRVCPLTSIGVPCPTTGVSLYSNYNLTPPTIPNPTTLNAQGILNVFVTDGNYLIQVTPVATQPQNVYTFYFISGSSNGITALTGDVDANGPGSAVATVVAIPPHVTLTSTPSAGYVPTATGSNAATWQGPASSIANCFLPMSNGTLFVASVIDQGCTLANFLSIGGGFGINIPSSSLGITSFSPTTQQHIGTATSLISAPSTPTLYIGEGFNSGLTVSATSLGSGYASAIRITCTISGGTFSVPATCIAVGNTVNSTLVVVVNNPGVYSSAAGATIAVSGGTGSGWAGTLSLVGGVAQQESWSTNASYGFNGGSTTDTASSLLSFQYSGRQSTSGSPGVQFINQPLQGVASGWLFNLNATVNAFAINSEANLTATRTYSKPDASGLEMVIVTIVAASNCGSLSGSTGCYQINDGTGTHFIPKF